MFFLSKYLSLYQENYRKNYKSTQKFCHSLLLKNTTEITTNPSPLRVIMSPPKKLQKILQFTPEIRQHFIHQKYYRKYYKSVSSQNNYVFTEKTTKNTTIHPRNSATLYSSKILQKLLQIHLLSE